MFLPKTCLCPPSCQDAGQPRPGHAPANPVPSDPSRQEGQATMWRGGRIPWGNDRWHGDDSYATQTTPSWVPHIPAPPHLTLVPTQRWGDRDRPRTLARTSGSLPPGGTLPYGSTSGGSQTDEGAAGPACAMFWSLSWWHAMETNLYPRRLMSSEWQWR